MILDTLLGINKRNLDVLSVYNPRHAFPLVDNKVKTKELLKPAGVPCPETIAVVRNFFEVESVLTGLKEVPDFVVKPAGGRAGGGILLVETGKNGVWKTPSGKILSADDLEKHFGDILFGVYSFGKMDDCVLVEERLVPAGFLLDIYSRGIPDIRVIVFKKKAVMAMLRIPTDKSDGKANLHQGAIGVAVDIENGVTGSGVFMGKRVLDHPDTGKKLCGLDIPGWETIVSIAESSASVVPLEYLGVDIVIDGKNGPMVLELNARPGLQIQVVNRKGLVSVLDGVD